MAHRVQKPRGSVVSSAAPSPAAVEAARLERVEEAMLKFCGDLNSLVGRVMVPVEMKGQGGMDPLTAGIYEAAVEAGLDYNAVLGGDDPLDTPSWMKNAARVLVKLRAKIPKSALHRVKELKDADARAAYAYADGYFDTGEPETEAVQDLAACLLDFAFTRQGLDDHFVPETPKELPAAAETQEEEPHKYELFVKAVKETLKTWRVGHSMSAREMSTTSIYRIAMVHSGMPTGDELAKNCYQGAQKHKHANRLLLIGHAAFALEVISIQRRLEYKTVPYKLVKRFCRTCAESLDAKRHGCCHADFSNQESELKHMQLMLEMEYRSGMLSGGFFGLGNESTTRKKGYLLRETTLEEGETKYEVNVLDVWQEGIWQEVADREAGERLAKRVRAEHGRGRALVPDNLASKGLQFEQTSTDAFSDQTSMTLANPKIEIEMLREDIGIYEERKAQAMLGKNIKWVATLLGAIAFAMTGKVVIIPMILVGWVMAYCLIDKRALKADQERLALEPSKDKLRADAVEEFFVKSDS